MSTAKVTKVTLAQRIRGLIAGTLKHSPGGSLTLDGQPFTADTLIQVLQSLEDALSKVDTAKASWKDALKGLADVKAKVNPVIGAFRTWIKATHGSAPATLADFGMAPHKVPTPLTAEKKAVAVAKRAATRAARHTVGPKKKAAIKGDATVTVITTATPPPPAKPT
jgi:hypothetical protein